MTTLTPTHPLTDRATWLAQRRLLLEQEKALTRQHDALARARRALPWVQVDGDERFEGADGPVTLAGLFDGRSQLLVQHFMLGPGWPEGCPSCSYMADHVDGMRPHLAARDLSFVAVSHAPWAEIERFRRRMGWGFRWVSSHGSAFNRRYGVSFEAAELAAGEVDYNYTRQPFPATEAPGLSVFRRDADGRVFHTYSTYGRGVEVMMGTYALLDLTPRGRDEAGLAHTMAWVRHHDRYEPRPAASDAAHACCAHAAAP